MTPNMPEPQPAEGDTQYQVVIHLDLDGKTLDGEPAAVVPVVLDLIARTVAQNIEPMVEALCAQRMIDSAPMPASGNLL